MAIQHSTDESRPGDPPVVLTATEARQGVLGRPVLAVLVIGLVLALIVWAGLELWGMSIAPRETIGTRPATTESRQPERIDDNPPAGDKRQTEPVLVDPQPTGNQ